MMMIKQSNNAVRVNLFCQITNILFIGDALSPDNNQPFSTKDRDNDVWSGNCAESKHGAFWYRGCGPANLNGKYLGKRVHRRTGVWWGHWNWHQYSYYSLKRVEMKIKPN